MVFVFLFLIYFTSYPIASCIHVAANGIVLFFFTKEQKQYPAVYGHRIFICPSVDGRSGCLHILAVVNGAALNIGVRVSFWIIVLSGYIPRSGIARSYGSSISRFLGKLHTVLLAAPTYVPPNSVGQFPFLHTLSSACYLQTF